MFAFPRVAVATAASVLLAGIGHPQWSCFRQGNSDPLSGRCGPAPGCITLIPAWTVYVKTSNTFTSYLDELNFDPITTVRTYSANVRSVRVITSYRHDICFSGGCCNTCSVTASQQATCMIYQYYPSTYCTGAPIPERPFVFLGRNLCSLGSNCDINP